jgi:hypothetical protein
VSAFQDQMTADLGVFFNMNEFAGPHNINGVAGVICILEEEDIGSLRPGLGAFQGTFKDNLLLQICQSLWEWDEPTYNDFVTVDSARYRIKKSALVAGKYDLLLEAVA